VSTGLVILSALLGGGAALVISAKYLKRLSEAGTLVATLARRPRVRVRDIQGGLVRITGQVRAVTPLLSAPVTGRACVAYHLLIEEWIERRGVGGWYGLLDSQDARTFAVTDESGEATIDTTGPTALLLVFDRCGPTHQLDATEGAQRELLKTLLQAGGISTTGIFGKSKILRFAEGVLLEGERVSVGGNGLREVTLDGERASTRAPPERVIVRGTPQEPLLISDSPEAHGSAKTG
jgi:hypothetical protein